MIAVGVSGRRATVTGGMSMFRSKRLVNLLKKITVFAEQHVSKRKDRTHRCTQPCNPYQNMHESDSKREK